MSSRERDPFSKSTLQAGVLQRAVGLNLEGGGAARGQVRVKGFGKLHVDGAVGGKVQLSLILEREADLSVKIGLIAGDVQRVKGDARVGESGMNATRALKVDPGNSERHLVDAGIAMHLVGMSQWPIDCDRSCQGGFAGQYLNMSHSQQRADVEVCEAQPSLRWIAGAERSLAMQLEFSTLKARGGVISDRSVCGMGGKIQAAERLRCQG